MDLKFKERILRMVIKRQRDLTNVLAAEWSRRQRNAWHPRENYVARSASGSQNALDADKKVSAMANCVYTIFFCLFLY